MATRRKPQPVQIIDGRWYALGAYDRTIVLMRELYPYEGAEYLTFLRSRK